ncbi:MAG: hypothetical protein AAGA65_00860 [Actinomycetota bacterium]
MTDRSDRLILWGAAGAGLATAVLGVILFLVLPGSAELSDGFRTPIIAFEFAQSDADLRFLSGDSDLSRANRDKMDQAHRWDMAFPVAYGLFLALLLVQLARSGFRPGRGFAVVALLAIPFDIWENTILLEITDVLRNGESAAGLLDDLQWATWLKWGAIGISAGAIGLGRFRERAYFTAVLGIVTLAVTAVCRLLDSDPTCVETMSLLVFVFFLWCIVQQFRLVYTSRSPQV